MISIVVAAPAIFVYVSLCKRFQIVCWCFVYRTCESWIWLQKWCHIVFSIGTLLGSVFSGAHIFALILNLDVLNRKKVREDEDVEITKKKSRRKPEECPEEIRLRALMLTEYLFDLNLLLCIIFLEFNVVHHVSFIHIRRNVTVRECSTLHHMLPFTFMHKSLLIYLLTLFSLLCVSHFHCLFRLLLLLCDDGVLGWIYWGDNNVDFYHRSTGNRNANKITPYWILPCEHFRWWCWCAFKTTTTTKNRFLHEKREALDAIELLKLFAKHKGLSIEIAADEDASNQLRTTISTDNFDEDAANCDDIHAESITLTSIIDETMARTTKDIHHHNVIETQPPASQTANNQLPNPATDKLLIEQATPISMKKSTADIWYKFKHFIHRMCFCNTIHSLKT